MYSCTREYSEYADLSQLTTEDAEYYCQAIEDWNRSCYIDMRNKVFYNNDLDSLGLFILHKNRRHSYWTIEIRYDTKCSLAIFRHEVGHMLGYYHYYNEWMNPIIFCN